MEGSVVRPTRLVDRALDGAEVAARPTTRPTIDGRGGPGAIAPWRRPKRERERERERVRATERTDVGWDIALAPRWRRRIKRQQIETERERRRQDQQRRTYRK